jgi:hypothetical protein
VTGEYVKDGPHEGGIYHRITFLNRRIIKLSRKLNMDFVTSDSISPRLIDEFGVPMNDFIMNAEKRIFTLIMCLNRTYGIRRDFSDVFQLMSLMRYLD